MGAGCLIMIGGVALRKESVDRNSCYLDNIEITQAVALRKESVDRNMVFCVDCLKSTWSLSARRAWIEIKSLRFTSCSLRCRSPQGERG